MIGPAETVALPPVCWGTAGPFARPARPTARSGHRSGSDAARAPAGPRSGRGSGELHPTSLAKHDTGDGTWDAAGCSTRTPRGTSTVLSRARAVDRSGRLLMRARDPVEPVAFRQGATTCRLRDVRDVARRTPTAVASCRPTTGTTRERRATERSGYALRSCACFSTPSHSRLGLASRGGSSRAIGSAAATGNSEVGHVERAAAGCDHWTRASRRGIAIPTLLAGWAALEVAGDPGTIGWRTWSSRFRGNDRLSERLPLPDEVGWR